jgi:hypothetical protein
MGPMIDGLDARRTRLLTAPLADALAAGTAPGDGASPGATRLTCPRCATAMGERLADATVLVAIRDRHSNTELLHLRAGVLVRPCRHCGALVALVAPGAAPAAPPADGPSSFLGRSPCN